MRTTIKPIATAIISILFLFFTFIYFSYFSMPNNICYEKIDANFEKAHEVAKRGTFKNAYVDFNGSEVISINATKGTKIKIGYSSSVKAGSLTIEIKDPYGNTIKTLPPSKSGSISIAIAETGRVSIAVTGKSTTGSFKMNWRRQLF